MKIAIVSTCVPFVWGGAEFLAESLKDKLVEFGNQAQIIRIPFRWYPPQEILEHMLACRLMRFENIDRVIGLKFPAYGVKHPDKVLWLLHQHRQAYDLWGTPYQDIPSTPEGLQIREAIIRSDNQYLGEVKKIYTNSAVVSQRLKKFNGFPSEVLFPPLMDENIFFCSEFGDYITCVSRVSRGKRQHLAVSAMKYTRSAVRLIIAGNPDTEDDMNEINAIIKKEHLGEKVKIIGHFISQAEKAQLLANSLACIYIPFDEDSYGYVSLEAYHSKKPVITCTDSGGTISVVKNGETGYVVPPTPEAIAEAMDRLFNDRAKTRRMGQAGLDNLLALNITWKNVIERLTA
jgi:glycosyltransferase involved in cell wall biosynthesis